jgi:hypothetical protein
MPATQLNLEYTICQIQSGQFSMAAKSHRQEGGFPTLAIEAGPADVKWTLRNLGQGIAETVVGTERRDRVDFYFTLAGLRTDLSKFPAASALSNPMHRRPPRSSAGTERKEGKRVRLEAPICSFLPIKDVVIHSQRAPAFTATATDAILHLDMETGPARIYGTEIFEVHFGIEAIYAISTGSPGASEAIITMSHAVYATILNELKHAIR